MIRNWSIRNRVLLLALLPVIILGLVLGTYFIHSRVRDLKSSQLALGRAIVNQLAPLSIYGVLTHNPQTLQALAQSAAMEPNIESVTITDNAGRVLAQVKHVISENRGLINVMARAIGAETGFEGALVFTRTITVAQSGTNGAGILGSVTVRLSEVHFAERQAAIIVNGGIIMLVCLAFSMLLALIISGSVVTPISRIIAMVSRFSAGEHSVRVPEHSGGELQRLERGINRMAANAQRSQQELQEQVDQATSELRGTLEEMEIKSVELDLARKRAVEASHVKSEFLANMSHEIRTPMNAVLGFSDLLAKTSLNDGQRNYLDTLRQSAHTLLALLDNILSAARLETGASDVHARSFVLRDVLEEIVQISAMEAYAKRLDLVLLMLGDGGQAILGDRVMLSRALSNLVMNAIKFTDAGSIVIQSHSQRRSSGSVRVEIRVTDTGIGIREQDRRRLFEPFFQINSATDRQHGGAGLGLYITKKLIEQLGGKLTLTSAVGYGSEFQLSLTFAPDETVLSPVPGSPPPSAGNKPLLAYESHPQAAEALLARLERLGWKTRTVINLAQLREILQTSTLRDSYSAAVISLSYGELHEPSALDGLTMGAAEGFPVLALVNSLNAEVQADISRRIAGPCLPKSLTESVLGRQLERLFGGTPTLESVESSVDAATFYDMHVIVADDNRINRLLARLLLEKYGINVLEAKTGQEVMNLVNANSINLILLDMHMPGEDGWQIIKRLQSSPPMQRAIPVIALSAAHADKSGRSLEELGLGGWLMKPLEEKDLREILLKYRGASGASATNAHALAMHAPGDLQAAIADLRPSIRQMLLEDLPVQWQAIETVWQDRNFMQLKEQVHKLNGSAAFCRLNILRDACEHLEQHLRDGGNEDVLQLIGQLNRSVQETLAALHSFDLRLATDS